MVIMERQCVLKIVEWGDIVDHLTRFLRISKPG